MRNLLILILGVCVLGGCSMDGNTPAPPTKPIDMKGPGVDPKVSDLSSKYEQAGARADASMEAGAAAMRAAQAHTGGK